jgi:hypothetical protein
MKVEQTTTKPKRRKRFHENTSESYDLGFQPVAKEDMDARSRYLAANNRHFGANIGFALERVSK